MPISEILDGVWAENTAVINHSNATTNVHGAGVYTIEHTGNVNPRFRHFVGSFDKNYTVVAGIWAQVNDPNQTDFDDRFVTQAGVVGNVETSGNLDEIKWPNVVLNAGTYLIKISYWRTTFNGILELLHGLVSMGTIDTSGGNAYNVVGTITYSPTSRSVADFRMRVNGTTSFGYGLLVSRIEIFKTG